MNIEWEEFQRLMEAEMRKVYSETVVDYAMNPRNAGIMPGANAVSRITGPCGDTMEIWLNIDNDVIIDATFMTDGCGTTIAAGSMVTEMAKGKSLLDSLKISQQEVLNALGGLPEESKHCALLVANTLKDAIRNYLGCHNEPQKRTGGSP